MLFCSSLLLTKDPGHVYDNIYAFRLLIFEEITTVVEQVNLCIAMELQNSNGSIIGINVCWQLLAQRIIMHANLKSPMYWLQKQNL